MLYDVLILNICVYVVRVTEHIKIIENCYFLCSTMFNFIIYDEWFNDLLLNEKSFTIFPITNAI